VLGEAILELGPSLPGCSTLWRPFSK